MSVWACPETCQSQKFEAQLDVDAEETKEVHQPGSALIKRCMNKEVQQKNTAIGKHLTLKSASSRERVYQKVYQSRSA